MVPDLQRIAVSFWSCAAFTNISKKVPFLSYLCASLFIKKWQFSCLLFDTFDKNMPLEVIYQGLAYQK